ncbi:hypothetical protein RvY_05987 [Ramazzottius varieornatus]|uniref:Uncharacterized protein n=1 Tax=Ramazzottius varieornatus TaxID=947166 RepID=A0A1D1V2G9_RAMVA|nr:hypothetical protein RvY_05987 [Ramazzottius varieornatus]
MEKLWTECALQYGIPELANPLWDKGWRVNGDMDMARKKRKLGKVDEENGEDEEKLSAGDVVFGRLQVRRKMWRSERLGVLHKEPSAFKKYFKFRSSRTTC